MERDSIELHNRILNIISQIEGIDIDLLSQSLEMPQETILEILYRVGEYFPSSIIILRNSDNKEIVLINPKLTDEIRIFLDSGGFKNVPNFNLFFNIESPTIGDISQNSA